MTLFNYSQDPLYPDRYSRDKRWARVLPLHGRHLQTSELIEMQSILHDNLKQGMNTLFSSGTVLKGLRLSVVSQDSTQITLSCSAGQIYVEGVVLDVPSGTFNLSTSGEFLIGVSVVEKIITEEDDPSLRDPIKDGTQYGLPGAARLVWVPSLDVNNSAAFTIGRLLDGNLIQKELNPFNNLEELLSTYTYERSGNFCVSGLEVTSLPQQATTSANQNKYTAAQASTDLAQKSLQETLTAANEKQTELNNLKTQLSSAVQAYQVSPTTANSILVSDLTQRVGLREAEYNTLARQLVSRSNLFQEESRGLEAAKSLLLDKVVLSVGPGTAYVKGHRIHQETPTLLNVPRTLSTNKVDSATFTYLGQKGTTKRKLLLDSSYSVLDIKTLATTLRLTISFIQYGSLTGSVQVDIQLSSLTFSSISDLLDLIVSELNASTIIQAGFTYSSTVFTLAAADLRSLIKSYVVVSKQGLDTLVFQSTTSKASANQIQVNTLVGRMISGVNTFPGTGLTFDLGQTNLAGSGDTSTFQLGFRPVAEVTNLTAEVEANLTPIVRGTVAGTSDFLGENTIFQVTAVVQGGTTYIEGVDFTLTNQSQLDWSLSGSEPAVGSTYYVSFLYTQALTLNKDYQLDATDSIQFIGRTPAVGQQFTVSYSYYLAQAGVITLNKEGQFSYVLSAAAADPVPPSVSEELLPIASFKLFPTKVEIKAEDCKAITFSEVRSMANRVKQTSLDLDQLNFKLDTYSQSLKDFKKIPLGIITEQLNGLNGLVLDSNFTAAISLSIQALTAGYTYKDIPLKYVSGGSLAQNRLGVSSYVTLPYTSINLLSQDRLTRSRTLNIQSGAVFRGKMYVTPQLAFLTTGAATLTPCDAIAQTTTLLNRTGGSSSILQKISSTTRILFQNAAKLIEQAFLRGNPIGSLGETSSSLLSIPEKQVQAKPITVQVLAEGLAPNSEGYQLYFAGKEIKDYTLLNLTPMSLQVLGTIRAKADGSINLQFTVPSGLPCGSYAIELISTNGYCRSKISFFNNLLTHVVEGAISNWSATALLPQAVEAIALEDRELYDSPVFNVGSSLSNPGTLVELGITNPTLAQQFPVGYQSLNQTFDLPDVYFLTQLTLKIKSVPVSGSLIVYLREAGLNGPIKNTLGIADAATYQVSPDGSQATTFTFDTPVMVQANKKYCISLEGSGYEVFSAEVGVADLLNGGLVGDQLFLKGSLYLSLDGYSVNEVVNEDLTFGLKRAQFQTTPVIVDLGSYGISDSFSNITYFCLNARNLLPDRTDIKFEYLVSGGSTWVGFIANQPVCLSQKTGSIQIRATLSTSQDNASPVLMLEGSSVSLYSNQLTTTVTSKQITCPVYRNIVVTLQYIKPTNTNIRVFYSSNNGLSTEGQEWFELSFLAGSEKILDAGLGLIEGQYTVTGLSELAFLLTPRTLFRYKIELTADSNTLNSPIVKNISAYVY